MWYAPKVFLPKNLQEKSQQRAMEWEVHWNNISYPFMSLDCKNNSGSASAWRYRHDRPMEPRIILQFFKKILMQETRECSKLVYIITQSNNTQCLSVTNWHFTKHLWTLLMSNGVNEITVLCNLRLWKKIIRNSCINSTQTCAWFKSTSVRSTFVAKKSCTAVNKRH